MRLPQLRQVEDEIYAELMAAPERLICVKSKILSKKFIELEYPMHEAAPSWSTSIFIEMTAVMLDGCSDRLATQGYQVYSRLQ